MIAFCEMPIFHPLVLGAWYYVFRNPNPDPKIVQASLGCVGKLASLPGNDGIAILTFGGGKGIYITREMVIPVAQMGCC